MNIIAAYSHNIDNLLSQPARLTEPWTELSGQWSLVEEPTAEETAVGIHVACRWSL